MKERCMLCLTKLRGEIMYGVFNVEKFTLINVVGCFLFQFQVMSSIAKWGGQIKMTKREIRDFMILEW